MSSTASDFINLFVQPPGDLFFFLAVFAVGQISLMMALGQRLRRPQAAAARRYVIASAGIVGVWSLLMLGAFAALISGQTSDAILPPLERAAHVVTILLVSWAFLTADHNRWGTVSGRVLRLLLALVAVGYLLTALEWSSVWTNADFNRTSYSVTWTFIAAVFSGAAILLTLTNIRWIVDAPLKLVALAVLLLGYGITLGQVAQDSIRGDYAGAARLAFLAALLIFPTVIYRLVVGQLEAEAAQTAALARAELQARAVPRDDSTASERENAQLMRALGLMLEHATPEIIPQRVVQAALQVLKADVTALLSAEDANYADVVTGMDRVLSRELNGISLNLDEQPALASAIERRVQYALLPGEDDDALRDLYTRLDIEPVGPAYFQPVVSERTLYGVLLVANPYSARAFNDAELSLLKGMSVIAANLLALSNAARDARLEAEGRIIQAMIQGVSPDDLSSGSALTLWEEMRGELEASRDQIMQLSRQVMQLKLELDDERSRLALAMESTEEGKSISQRVLAINEERQRVQEERDRLAARLRDAEAALASAASGDDVTVLRAMLDALNRERDELAAQRDRLAKALEDARAQAGVPAAGNAAAMREIIERMLDETAAYERERHAMSERLSEIEAQLTSLGVAEGTVGIAQIIAQLQEQRAALQVQNERLKQERDALLSQRSALDTAMQDEGLREQQIDILQTEIAHLAADREAAIKQRDKLRAERDDLLGKIETLRGQYARVLAEMAGFEQELTEEHEEQVQLRAQLEAVDAERIALETERDRLLAERSALLIERDQLLARIEGNRERVQQLGEDGVGSLTRVIESLTAERSALERELNETKTALAVLEDKLDLLQIKASSAPPPQVVYRTDDPEVFLSMVQELRTPMTSIIGYVDLLLNESAGILGEMQRKFMQRVSVNVKRLAGMLDDLVRMTALDAGRFTLAKAPVDVIEVIEDAITEVTDQLREKGLSVHLHLAEDIPPIVADRDAIHQVIGQLLTNAYLVSPTGGDIYIAARVGHAGNGVPNGHDGDQVLVSVEDRGGGIAEEDIPRVFARKYKAENPLIQGLGDTGVGLAIAKALIEAHGGEVSLKTRAGAGSTFIFTLPIEPLDADTGELLSEREG